MNRLSSEYNTVASERDNLLEISNKLRSELTRLRNNHKRRDEDSDSIQSYHDKGQSQVLNQTFEELDVDDLARSVWNKAVVKPAVLQREVRTKYFQLHCHHGDKRKRTRTRICRVISH